MAEPIAIIGLGCRFPGAPGVEAYWRLLSSGTDAVGVLPRSRFDMDAVFDEEPGRPGCLPSRDGGFLDAIDAFDGAFFGISQREAERMDPQQRLLLETAWEALEDAGEVAERLVGSRTGVYVGVTTSDYEALQYYLCDPTTIDLYVATGGARSVLAGRLSYALGLRGPSLALDSACSSSLVAVHLACQSLRSRETELAIAAGVNLVLGPQQTLAFARARMLSPRGRCHAFDATADGFVRSDGVGVVLLKRLSDAVAAGNPVHAVILGSAVNSDGSASGTLATPSVLGQQEVLRTAYENAGVDPALVDYVECHGTGTPVGDPIELEALGSVLGEGRDSDRPCAIGSVKTNIGHTEAAAGVAGLIKVALALERRLIPASLHVTEANPAIPFADLKLDVQRSSSQWCSSTARTAGVSSFGIGGTNAHVVLGEAPPFVEPPAPVAGPQLIVLSAHSTKALQARAAALRDWLAGGETPAVSLRDLAYTLATRRTHFDHRGAFVAESIAECVQQLDALTNGNTAEFLATGRRRADQHSKTVVVVPGQGGQWERMGSGLYQRFDVFRRTIDDAARAMRPHVDWDLVRLLRDGAAPGLTRLDVVQPSLFAVEVALAALLESWGIRIDAVAGQSMGEVAAAHVAGILTLEDAALIICRRSQLLLPLRGRGGMVAVGLSHADAEQAIAGYEDSVSVAVVSGPTSVVLSGASDALQAIVANLEARSVFCRTVNVDFASHSPQVDVLREPLLRAFDDIRPLPPRRTFVSTVIDDPAAPCDFGPQYWVDNLRRPVRLWPVVRDLLGAGHDVFLELGPHPLLVGAIQQAAVETRKSVMVLPTMSREMPEVPTLLSTVGAIHTHGVSVDWSAIVPQGRCISLPPPPWQRGRAWRDDGAFDADRRGVERVANAHPWLGEPVTPASVDGLLVWETTLNTERTPFLQDHRVNELVVFPAAGFIELSLAVAGHLWGASPCAVEDLRLEHALVLTPGAPPRLQVSAERHGIDSADVHVFSQSTPGGNDTPWTVHAACRVRQLTDDVPTPRPPQPSSGTTIGEVELYEALAKRGLSYGPAFRGIEHLQRDTKGHISARIRPRVTSTELRRYHAHPAVIDAALQATAASALLDEAGTPGPIVPVFLRSFRYWPALDAGTRFWIQSDTPPRQDGTKQVESRATLFDDEQRIVATIHGLVVQPLERAPADDAGEPSVMYEVHWEELQLPAAAAPAIDRLLAGSSVVLFFTDGSDLARQLQEDAARAGRQCIVVRAADRFDVVGDTIVMDPSDRDHFDRLADAIPVGARGASVVYLWAAAVAPSWSPRANEVTLAAPLSLIQALTSRTAARWHVLFVTRNAVRIDPADVVSPAQAALWGLARVARREHPELACRLLDVDEGTTSHRLLSAPTLDHPELAFRQDRFFAPRLNRAGAPSTRTTRRLACEAPDEPFELVAAPVGQLGTLDLRFADRLSPVGEDVVVRTEAAGLNFIDVMRALGVRPGREETAARLGMECSGRLLNQKGEPESEVIAVAPSTRCCFGSHVITRRELVVPKPHAWTWAQAAAAPIAYLTAHYALNELARIQPGETVLIHAASGGVGLAALDIARQRGARVLATAGSPEKRALLESLGVVATMDSRSLEFERTVRQLTDDRGVDVVINALAGEALRASLRLLAPWGRFVELGKRDVYRGASLPLTTLRDGRSLFVVDIDRLLDDRPAEARRHLVAALEYAERGGLLLQHVMAFPISSAREAFQTMARAEHRGKIVLTFADPAAAPIVATRSIRRDGAYLVTGGFGALGLCVAEWMAERGAGTIVLVGRRPPSSDAAATIEAVRRAGACVITEFMDVGDSAAVEALFARLASLAHPLRGIVHAAGILDDGVLARLDGDRLAAVLRPKADGAWNLHRASRNLRLDSFVLFSSAASLLGNPGQANYAAANAFMDGLVDFRLGQHLPALGINWGPWSEIGLGTLEGRQAMLRRRGIDALPPPLALRVLRRLLDEGSQGQVAVVPFVWDEWLQQPEAAEPFFDHMRRQPDSPSSAAERPIRERVLEAPPDDRVAVTADHLAKVVAGILRSVKGDLLPDAHVPLNRLGIDSLMAVELRNRVDADLRVALPPVVFLRGPTITQLASTICGVLEANDRDGEQIAPAAAVPPDQEQVAALSDTEVMSALHAVLNHHRRTPHA